MQCHVQATTPDGPGVCAKSVLTSVSLLIIMTVHIPLQCVSFCTIARCRPLAIRHNRQRLASALGPAWRRSMHLLRSAEIPCNCRPMVGSRCHNVMMGGRYPLPRASFRGTSSRTVAGKGSTGGIGLFVLLRGILTPRTQVYLWPLLLAAAGPGACRSTLNFHLPVRTVSAVLHQ